MAERLPRTHNRRSAHTQQPAAPAPIQPSRSDSSNSEHQRYIEQVQAEKSELVTENLRLRRKTAELASQLALSHARHQWMSKRIRAHAASNNEIVARSAEEQAPPPQDAISPPGLRQFQRRSTPSSSRASSSSVQGPSHEIHLAVEQSEGEARSEPSSSVGSLQEDGEGWTTAAWLSSLKTANIVASALLEPLSRTKRGGRRELAFARALVQCASRETVYQILKGSQLIDELADELWCGLQQLARASAATGYELHEKFRQEAEVFTLDFGGLSTFFGGLDALVGPPSPQLRAATQREHCESADSTDQFESPNYGTLTTPLIEWHFVTHPESGLTKLGLSAWPEETNLDASRRRSPRALSSFMPQLKRVNAQLHKLESRAPISEEELICTRMYTGPLFVKYNAVLRGVRSKCSRQFARWFASCKGNRYATSLHIINTAVNKLSQLTQATRVYRGISGGLLPASFWQPNAFHVRGGVEGAFMSCTRDYSVALAYASSSSGGAGVVFELTQGFVDRGASLDWLSMYSFEQEILLPPLSSLEVQSTRVDGGTLVVTCRVSINLTNDPIDLVVSKRQRLLKEMAQGMLVEVSTASVESGAAVSKIGAERLNKLLREGPLSHPPTHYNVDDHFAKALSHMLELRSEVISSLTMLPANEPAVCLRKWSLRSPQRVQTLCVWLESQTVTRSLDLSDCDLSLDGATVVGAALRRNRVLQSLRLTRDAAELPIQELTGHMPISKLNLSRKRLGALAGCLLSELIACNSTIETLDLSANMLGQREDAACHAISDALKARPARLKTLKLAKNYIGDAGARALADGLCQCATLHTVDLSSNEIGAAAALEIAGKLQHHGTIRTLQLQGNGIDKQTADQLFKLLAHRVQC